MCIFNEKKKKYLKFISRTRDESIYYCIPLTRKTPIYLHFPLLTGLKLQKNHILMFNDYKLQT